MKRILALILLFPLVSFSNPGLLISQARLPTESYHQALKRVKEYLPQKKFKSVAQGRTPVSKQLPIDKMDFSLAPEVVSYQDLIEMFYLVRDSRFLHAENDPNFDRRISWLYPDDGCFARAALSGIKLESDKRIRPAKIFAFGDLLLTTPYSPHGAVSWWYHVSLVVKYMGAYYVLDPALNQDSPLLAEDWFNKMGDLIDIKGVVCNGYTYDPFDNCTMATLDSDESALKDELNYLHKEWDRMGVLGLEPTVILGMNPPWLPVSLKNLFHH